MSVVSDIFYGIGTTAMIIAFVAVCRNFRFQKICREAEKSKVVNLYSGWWYRVEIIAVMIGIVCVTAGDIFKRW